MEDTPRTDTSRLEIWGGLECTHNRVGNSFFDQIEWTGHVHRKDDLEQFAALGIRALRYPALWEWAAAKGRTDLDWSRTDFLLSRVRKSGLRPVIGMVHHGSGPQWTSLIDDSFAPGLAHYATEFAKRFPWVEDYTPINEPLTTARFSALYGHWYPHLREPLAFVRALFNQCRAIVLAMQAVRTQQPAARLIQTEDTGRIFSTPTLSYQADFDNARRWLPFDLLCGRVDRHYPIGDYLLWLGLSETELHWFHDNCCPPDVLGINYYVTSERFLDDRIALYPGEPCGGNGRHLYVDTEAVRVRPEGLAGVEGALREAWDRYGIPVAVTEAHLGCSREEQLRWLWEVWQGAESARSAGARVIAVTAWSLLGALDWDSLVTKPRGHYEAGVFDIRSGRPRPTALAKLVSTIADGRNPEIPALRQPGWWRRPARFLAGVPGRTGTPGRPSIDGQPILITGASGTLGRAFARSCEDRCLPCRLVSRAEMDIADDESVAAAIREFEPWAIINAAGYVRVDAAESDSDRCHRENVLGASTLANACAAAAIPFVTFSTDLVFDGNQRRPYREQDPVNPLNVYGRSKAEAEQCVVNAHQGALIIRSSAFFSAHDEFNFMTVVLRELAAGKTFAAANDAVVSPTYVPDLANAAIDLLVDGEAGIWHLANQGEVSWAELARIVAAEAGFDPDSILPRSRESLGWAAPRPAYSALGSERGTLLPTLDGAIRRYLSNLTASPELVEASSN